MVTIGAQPVRVAPPRGTGTAATEAAQPVYTRYWLHNKGPAPVGNLPMGVHVHPTTVGLRGAEPATFTVTVASATVATAGRVELDVPAGLSVSTAGPGGFDLRPGDHQDFVCTVAAETAAPGRYFIAARIHDHLGQVLEDVVTVTVDGPPPAAVNPASAGPANVTAVLEPAEAGVAPGDRVVLTLRLTNPHRCAVRGEAQLITPYGTWGDPGDELAVGAPIQGFAVPAGETGTVSFTVSASASARAGAEWWALARIACFGEVSYTAAVPLVCRPG